jgi:hypothetical protein
VCDCDCKDGFGISSECRSPTHDLGVNDIGVAIVHGAKRRDIEIGIWRSCPDLKPGRVPVAFSDDRTVGRGLPFEHASVIKKTIVNGISPEAAPFYRVREGTET